MAEAKSVKDFIEDIRNNFVGKWRLEKSENFEDFMKEMGANFIARKMAASSTPDCEISIDGEDVKIATSTAFFTTDDVIKFDKEYDREIQKVMMKCQAKFEEGKIIRHMTAVDGSRKPQTQTREIVEGKMVMTLEVGDVKCKRIFGRI